MKKFIAILAVVLAAGAMAAQAKDLVVYFSATGNTQAVAREIARITGADIMRIEAAEPYAPNPYDDSERVQKEAYNDLRPAVAQLPDKETIAQYDRIYVGSPIWWHQPAMVVCTFLEAFDLSDKTIIPFFTYGATSYLNESMQKIYKVTPDSKHIPATLPEDLDADDITTPGRPDDSGIDMPGNANGVEGWLRRLGLHPEQPGISAVESEPLSYNISRSADVLTVEFPSGTDANSVAIYNLAGAVYLYSITDTATGRSYSGKIAPKTL